MNIKLKYGFNSIATIAVAIVLFILVNLTISYFDIKVDLTSNSLYTLTETSKQIIDKVSEDNQVHIYGLYDEIKDATQYGVLTDEAKLYDSYSNGKIKVEFVNPNDDPRFLSNIGVADRVKDNSDAYFVVQGIAPGIGKKTRLITQSDLIAERYDYSGKSLGDGFNSEQAFSGAIQYVTSDTTAKLYFIEGHEETSYSNFKALSDALIKNNYDLDHVNINITGKIPNDAKMIVFMSPKIDISTDERDIISNYLRNGGNAIFVMDSNENNTSFKNINYVLDMYALQVNPDIMYDERNSVSNNKYCMYTIGVETDANAEIGGGTYGAIVDKACSIKLMKKANSDLSVVSVLNSSPVAVSIDSETKKEDSGIKSIAALSDYARGEKSSRVMVLGDSDFLSDNYIAKYQDDIGNSNIKGFITWANWTQNVVDQLYISPKSLDTNTLTVEDSTATTIMYSMLSIVLLIFVFGFVAWFMRRHL